MKAALLMAMVFGICTLPCAGATVTVGVKVDPVGTWKCDYRIGDQNRSLELTIRRDGDRLAGTMSWPDQKDEMLNDVKLKDGKLTFSVVRKCMGQEFPLDFKLTVDGDKLIGKAAMATGSENQDYDIQGRRANKGK